ncbi:MAG TPA: M3 family oligoendopeptidase [Candidatus Acidoferrales bacterium]|nr:M3 family oligoendopeptidase [Candidatus Acidoferrales bacterium]
MTGSAHGRASAQGVRWDLSDLFSAPTDPKLEATLIECRERAHLFQRYRGTLGSTAANLLAALREFEEIEEALSRASSYASLLYASDSLNPQYQDLEQKVEQRVTEVRNLTLFFHLEWMGLEDEAADRLLGEALLAPYRHYLEVARRFRPHRLSEPEERIVNEKDMTGRNAFGRLFSEITSGLTFRLEEGGAEVELNLSEILSRLHRPERALREKAWKTLFGELARHGQVLSFIYDNLVQDHLTMDRLRRYPDPMRERHLANEIDPHAVALMMEVTERNYGLAQEYFKIKARLLGLARIALYDQYAPLGGTPPPVPFARAQGIILEALGAFAPEFRTIAGEFFSRRWIDAEVRKGKRGGAFCASPSPRLHPYILCNYTGDLRDVMTVAHELGHGLHGYLSRKQTFLNYDTPLTTAETASVFAEMLVFDYLLERETAPEAELALLAGKLEDIFATVYRQNVLTRFEQAVFAARRDGRLTAEAIGDFWIRANGKYYGDAVEIDDLYRWGWSYIPHFIHSRFYCYSYVFGELLTLALYRMYREQGKKFIPQYVALLEAGGCASPEELLRPLGVNIHEAAFWQKGFDEIRALVKRLHELVARSRVDAVR